MAAPFDLLNALGLTSCFVEFVGATLSTTGTIPAFLERAEEEGFAPDMCAYHRGVVGAALEGLMPVPDVLIATSCPCTAGVSTIENLARIFEKDLFVLHVPQTPTPENVRYLADQLKDMVAFVTDHTGAPLDDDALRSAITLTNHARSLLEEVYALAQHVPSPASSRVAWCGVAAPFDLLNALGLTSCFVEFVGATLSTTGT
ncbi:MAG: 2-hydroxyacyl-CoA dehydratase, partial [Deltaproteobacteria bacterium]|nr:2-hydroxyacyl-CoA dehydratase [Deltaproteobacteria bacterium]